jgi:hypothetical protein
MGIRAEDGGVNGGSRYITCIYEYVTMKPIILHN